MLILTCAQALSACGEDLSAPEAEYDILIYAALNPISSDLRSSVKRFNESHTDVQIEIADYSDDDGLDRLLIELALGQIPDIMELHRFGANGGNIFKSGRYLVVPGNYAAPAGEYWMPYRQMAQKGYLEDLWPYIEDDPALGRDGVLQAPLKAAEVSGGLYMLFGNICISTLVGRESVVGARYCWTLDDVMETYAGMPDDSTILRYSMTRATAFFSLLSNSLERYVDRETGECSFDSKGFRDLVGFMEGIPDDALDEKPREAEEEIMWRIKTGRQMLECMMIIWPREIGFSDAIFQERAAFVGYPTADGSSGSFFYPAEDILAMSSACRNKEAAWEFIRRLITSRSTKKQPLNVPYIPVNLNDYELLLWGELREAAESARLFDKPLEVFPARRYFTYGPEIRLMHLLTEDDIQRYRDLVDHTTLLYWPEDDLSNIVWETLGAYFAGDRELDDTIRLINNRVELYVNEQR
ncbi:MAG: extracellular solute-binding protein [Oscillospiraceae bacterium]|nr:extracellular solute-binding protein [Oscillospiraceae bacterium]